jgi:mRNA-degrading endonuclease RelE of RelBE toxin-antitoxin system
MSNQKAFNERMEKLVEELRSKESELAAKVSENQRLFVDCERLKEETNMYKGRCANLQRDV